MRISDWSSDVCSSDLAKGALRRLAGSVPDSVPLQTIDLTKARSLLATPAFDRKLARSFYRRWSASLEREHPELGLIAVTNLGWRHITRRSRRPERSEEHTSELQSLMRISYAVF